MSAGTGANPFDPSRYSTGRHTQDNCGSFRSAFQKGDSHDRLPISLLTFHTNPQFPGRWYSGHQLPVVPSIQLLG